MPIVEKFKKNAPGLLRELKGNPEEYWMQRGEKDALKLFWEMADRVPAYKDFLEKRDFDAKSVKTIEDFKRVPITDKQNYLLSYPLEALCWDEKFSEGQWTIASTSGSTGEPFYFPRTRFQDEQFALTAELVFVDYFGIDKKSTLFIDCFALGVWIGGMFSYQAVKYLSDKGDYPLTIITPGADKIETLKAIKGLAHRFDQIILGGYAPLVKDLIDDGIDAGIEWSRYSMKYFFAAEGFTEGYRDYIKQKGGVRDIYRGTINHYGTADLGTMSHETPLSILARRFAVKDAALYGDIFSETSRLPTLTQFIPELYFFEQIDGHLLCSGRGGLPLMRYDLKDRGNVYTLREFADIYARHGIDLVQEAKKVGISDTVWHLPFVYVAERTDFTVNIYSVNVFPESIRKALEDAELQKSLTGKFSMHVGYNEEQNQYFEINIELRPTAQESDVLRQKSYDAIITWLNKENSEWRDFWANESIQRKIAPKIILWPYQDPKHFKPGGKQKWVRGQS
ncbi:MAG: hypothetical protein A2679_00050 [Candidatus Sungbacteria bacterium RIFCSPHIGHO2_01_FULL_54_26]|nr:MAG: hypothetical protein A2679_00050 [Candidatus Sungbacteria bacterium RIFCSPHIGHO2_01_FULL_54_26]